MINTVVIEGRLGNAPELKYANNGKSFLTFSMCYEKAWMVQGQGWQTKPNFFDVVYWKENPEKLMQYLLKGVTVFVQGELKQDTWDDRKTGQKRSKPRRSPSGASRPTRAGIRDSSKGSSSMPNRNSSKVRSKGSCRTVSLNRLRRSRSNSSSLSNRGSSSSRTIFRFRHGDVWPAYVGHLLKEFR